MSKKAEHGGMNSTSTQLHNFSPEQDLLAQTDIGEDPAEDFSGHSHASTSKDSYSSNSKTSSSSSKESASVETFQPRWQMKTITNPEPAGARTANLTFSSKEPCTAPSMSTLPPASATGTWLKTERAELIEAPFVHDPLQHGCPMKVAQPALSVDVTSTGKKPPQYLAGRPTSSPDVQKVAAPPAVVDPHSSGIVDEDEVDHQDADLRFHTHANKKDFSHSAGEEKNHVPEYRPPPRLAWSTLRRAETEEVQQRGQGNEKNLDHAVGQGPGGVVVRPHGHAHMPADVEQGKMIHREAPPTSTPGATLEDGAGIGNQDETRCTARRPDSTSASAGETETTKLHDVGSARFGRGAAASKVVEQSEVEEKEDELPPPQLEDLEPCIKRLRSARRLVPTAEAAVQNIGAGLADEKNGNFSEKRNTCAGASMMCYPNSFHSQRMKSSSPSRRTEEVTTRRGHTPAIPLSSSKDEKMDERLLLRFASEQTGTRWRCSRAMDIDGVPGCGDEAAPSWRAVVAGDELEPHPNPQSTPVEVVGLQDDDLFSSYQSREGHDEQEHDITMDDNSAILATSSVNYAVESECIASQQQHQSIISSPGLASVVSAEAVRKGDGIAFGRTQGVDDGVAAADELPPDDSSCCRVVETARVEADTSRNRPPRSVILSALPPPVALQDEEPHRRSRLIHCRTDPRSTNGFSVVGGDERSAGSPDVLMLSSGHLQQGLPQPPGQRAARQVVSHITSSTVGPTAGQEPAGAAVSDASSMDHAVPAPRVLENTYTASATSGLIQDAPPVGQTSSSGGPDSLVPSKFPSTLGRPRPPRARTTTKLDLLLFSEQSSSELDFLLGSKLFAGTTQRSSSPPRHTPNFFDFGSTSSSTAGRFLNHRTTRLKDEVERVESVSDFLADLRTEERQFREGSRHYGSEDGTVAEGSCGGAQKEQMIRYEVAKSVDVSRKETTGGLVEDVSNCMEGDELLSRKPSALTDLMECLEREGAGLYVEGKIDFGQHHNSGVIQQASATVDSALTAETQEVEQPLEEVTVRPSAEEKDEAGAAPENMMKHWNRSRTADPAQGDERVDEPRTKLGVEAKYAAGSSRSAEHLPGRSSPREVALSDGDGNGNAMAINPFVDDDPLLQFPSATRTAPPSSTREIYYDPGCSEGREQAIQSSCAAVHAHTHPLAAPSMNPHAIAAGSSIAESSSKTEPTAQAGALRSSTLRGCEAARKPRTFPSKMRPLQEVRVNKQAPLRLSLPPESSCSEDDSGDHDGAGCAPPCTGRPSWPGSPPDANFATGGHDSCAINTPRRTAACSFSSKDEHQRGTLPSSCEQATITNLPSTLLYSSMANDVKVTFNIDPSRLLGVEAGDKTSQDAFVDAPSARGQYAKFRKGSASVPERLVSRSPGPKRLITILDDRLQVPLAVAAAQQRAALYREKSQEHERERKLEVEKKKRELFDKRDVRIQNFIVAQRARKIEKPNASRN
ncbi:unnamed protein product [Amoebophrya sp. A120]|nr:unnamed protein product [Amoebophrya sp. A120]|eukprot:GSA120T00015511001.1